VLKVTLHHAALRDVSPRNVIGRLDIGYARLDSMADYKTAMTIAGIGESATARIENYPRWSASIWDLVARAICCSLTGGKEVLSGVEYQRTGAFIDHLTAVIQHWPDGFAVGRATIGTATVTMRKAARCCYTAIFEDDLTGRHASDLFRHAPKVLTPWDLLARAYAQTVTGADQMPERPSLYAPIAFESSDGPVVPVNTLREPAHSGLLRWIRKKGISTMLTEVVAGPLRQGRPVRRVLEARGMTETTQTDTPKSKPPRTKIHRPSSAATRWHMSSAAVDRDVTEYGRWTDRQCVRHFARARWGDFKLVTCPHCETADKHYWNVERLRWKCKRCAKTFTVTSNSVLAGHHLSLQTILTAIFLWAAGAAGKPSLETRRILGVKSYNAVFVLEAKLREALRRGYMTGLLSGVVEMDGAHAAGRRASLKRGRPLNKPKKTDEEANEQTYRDATQTREEKERRKAEAAAMKASGGTVDPEYGFVYPASRRIIMTIRQRAGTPGKGACNTRVAVGAAESPEVVEAFIEKYVAVPETILATDTSSAYSKAGEQFKLHLKVNHSERLVGPGPDEHVNNSEGFTARQDRSELGIYLNLEPKYLLDYAVETAFREDHRRLSPGEVADVVLHYALNVGLSQDWRGYTQGKHRENELLTPTPRLAAPSGPKKGRKVNSTEEAWPPR
jgi:transposase-like protein